MEPTKGRSAIRHNGNEQQHFDRAYKVMLIGDSGVGKTCFLVRYRDDAFLAGSFISTVGIDFRNKIIDVDGMAVKLQIWDTAGQERFRSITHAYYRDANALLLLYDITNRTTFENIRAWIGEIDVCASGDILVMLLGNKADIVTGRTVAKAEAEQLAKEYNMPFMETSAKSGMNVNLAFLAITKKLMSSSSDSGKKNYRYNERMVASDGAGSNIGKRSFNIREFVCDEQNKEEKYCCGS